MESATRGVVVNQLQHVGFAISDITPGPFRSIEMAVGSHHEPILAGIETVEAAALLAGAEVPEAGRSVRACGPNQLLIVAEGDAADAARKGLKLFAAGHVPKN